MLHVFIRLFYILICILTVVSSINKDTIQNIDCYILKYQIPMELKHIKLFSRTVINNNVKRYSQITGLNVQDVKKCLNIK